MRDWNLAPALIASSTLGKFDIPISPVEELLPRGIPVVGEFHVDDGISARLDGIADQVKAGLLRRSTALSHVAPVARTHDVLPGVAPASGPRNDVVQAQLNR